MKRKMPKSGFSPVWARITAAVLVAAVLAAVSFYFFYMEPRRAVPILMYHGVSEKGEGTLFVLPRNFEKQMAFLRENGYNIISLDALAKGTLERKEFPPKTVVITFDDGYVDNYLNAFPVLARYKMPATVFLVTGWVSSKEGYLTWDQARVMASNGIDLGGHTRNHVFLPSASDEILGQEIAGAREDIEKNTGSSADYFCYPSGGFDKRAVDAVKRAGYKGACTTNRGRDRGNHDVYELNRVKVTNSDANKSFHFSAKLSGYYNLFRRMKYEGEYKTGKK